MSRLRLAVITFCAASSISLGVVAPAEAGEKGFWGPTEVNGVSQFPIYQTLGVTLYQTALTWDSIAPTRPAHPTDPGDPAYNWPTKFDAIIREATQNRMRVLLMIIGSPRWANGGKSREWAPSPKAFGDFAQAAARRYPAVREWMIWGEPSRTPNFQPLVPEKIGRPLTRKQSEAPRRYAAMLDAAYVGLKRVRRSNVVIGGNTYVAGDIRPLNWIKYMRLPNGRRPRLDVYGHNPFLLRPPYFRTPNLRNPPGLPESVDFSDLRRFQKVVNSAFGRRGSNVRRVPIFLSEFTVPTGPDSEFDFFTTREKQAQVISAAFRVAKQIKAYGLGWIHLYDDPARTDGVPRGQGGLIDADGKHKPGFDAFRRGRL